MLFDILFCFHSETKANHDPKWKTVFKQKQFSISSCSTQCSLLSQHNQSFKGKVVIMEFGYCQKAARSSENGFLGCQKPLISMRWQIICRYKNTLRYNSRMLLNYTYNKHLFTKQKSWSSVFCQWSLMLLLNRRWNTIGAYIWVMHIDHSSRLVYLTLQKERLQSWHVCAKPLPLIQQYQYQFIFNLFISQFLDILFCLF